MRCFTYTASFIVVSFTLVSSLAAQNQTQAKPGCTVHISPDLSASPLGPGREQGLFHLETNPSCAWAVLSPVPWLRFGIRSGANISGPTGTGNALVYYLVDANQGAARSATFQINGDSQAVYNLNQEGSGSSRPSVILSPKSGIGPSQIFSLTAVSPWIVAMGLAFDTDPPSGGCNILFFRTGGQGFLTVVNPGGSGSLPPIALPGMARSQTVIAPSMPASRASRLLLVR